MGPKPAMKRTLTFAVPAMTSPLVEMKAVKPSVPIHVNRSLGRSFPDEGPCGIGCAVNGQGYHRRVTVARILPRKQRRYPARRGLNPSHHTLLLCPLRRNAGAGTAGNGCRNSPLEKAPRAGLVPAR